LKTPANSLLAAALFVTAPLAADDHTHEHAHEIVESHSPDTRGPNISANLEHNSIDPDVHTSTISGGGYKGVGQHIGDASIDPSYQSGQASIATISGGYDNVNNQLAGTIAGGAHHVLFSGGDHGTIGGGSWNSILSGGYAVIAGGGGGSDPQSVAGDRSTISGGGGNHIEGRFNVIAGGYRNIIDGTAAGIGAGRDNFVDASFSYAVGERNHVEAQAVGSFTFGRDVRTGVPGSFSFSARGHAGQVVILNLNQTTFGESSVIMLAQGNWTTPIVPDNAVWMGESQLVVAEPGSKLTTAYKMTFVVSRQEIKHVEFTRVYDELGMGPVPAVLQIGNLGRLEMIVTGQAARTLNWNAAVTVSQVNLDY